VRVEWRQFRSWLVGQPLDSELHAAWAAINELLRSKLLTAGILPAPQALCETRDSGQWYYWPPKGGPNRGQPPHHRVCEACRRSLANGSLIKEEHRASRCGVVYECPDGACGPDGC
jgi:hypothetical protein